MKYLGLILIFVLFSTSCSKQTGNGPEGDAILHNYIYSETTQENCTQAMGVVFNIDLEISKNDSHNLASGICECRFKIYRKVEALSNISNKEEKNALLGMATAGQFKGIRDQAASDAGEFHLRELVKLHKDQETAFTQAQRFMAALRTEVEYTYTQDVKCTNLSNEWRSHYQIN